MTKKEAIEVALTAIGNELERFGIVTGQYEEYKEAERVLLEWLQEQN